MNERILLIEDDDVYVTLLQKALSRNGYLVESTGRGADGLRSVRSQRPNLVILDLLLPDMDGIEVCQQIRAEANIPIMMLTGKKKVDDRVEGLDAGADDYVIKPFDLPEFLARVRALLRRYSQEGTHVYSFSDLVLDTSTRMARRGEREIMLTSKEYDLLELFMRYPQKVLSRSLVYDRVWGYDFGGESNVLDVYVRYLREKLEMFGEPRLIHTVRGVGYVLRDQAKT